MIFDQLAHIKAYQGISRNLDTAIAFITSHNLHELPMGRTEINGTQVFLNKMEAETALETAKQYEVHKKYMDIQIDLAGTERIDTGRRVSFDNFDFDVEKDIGFIDTPFLASCTLGPGNFTICMAGEPHKPGITVTDDTKLVKCVLKVQVEES